MLTKKNKETNQTNNKQTDKHWSKHQPATCGEGSNTTRRRMTYLREIATVDWHSSDRCAASVVARRDKNTLPLNHASLETSVYLETYGPVYRLSQ